MNRFARRAWRLSLILFLALFARPTVAFGQEAADEAAGEEEEKVEEYIQELFLGESAYSQDKGEIQFSLGYFWNDGGDYSSTLPVIFEYGITDDFQVGVTLPANFDRNEVPELQDGLGNVEFEAYWAFLNDAETGWVVGLGFGYSLPESMTGAGDDAHIYEPFAVVYKDFGVDAVNASGAIEIEDSREADEATETNGEIAMAYLRPSRNLPIVWLLEAAVEIEADEAPVRIAPGAYYRPDGGIWEIGCSLPVGLTNDAPEIGAFAMLTFEFE